MHAKNPKSPSIRGRVLSIRIEQQMMGSVNTLGCPLRVPTARLVAAHPQISLTHD